MLINRITNLARDISLTNLTHINSLLESAAREVLRIVGDDTIFENYRRIFEFSYHNLPWYIHNKKILAVLRRDSYEGGLVECMQKSPLDLNKVKSGSGRLEEATDFSPVYIIGHDITAGTFGALHVFPPLDELSKQGEIWYIDLPHFPTDIDCWTINDLTTDLQGTDFGYWTDEMETAFILKSAINILVAKLSEVNIEEEDAEVSGLVSSTIAQLTVEWEHYKNILKGIDSDDIDKINQIKGLRGS